MPVTLKDIADRVGKSVSTVSRALAGFDDIGPKTRQEIQRVAREMGYEPNTSARNLQKQRTDTIALVLPTINQLRFSDPFFSELLSGIVEQTTKHGIGLSVTADIIHDEPETYLKQIRSQRVDGFIVVRTRLQDDRIELLCKHEIPFVSFGRVAENNDFHFVDEDGVYGIRQVVDHLVELGHTRLACIAEPLTLTKSHHRVQGFSEGLRVHDLPHNPELIVETQFRQRSGYEAAHRLLRLPTPPTAIVACNDLLAFGAMSAARELGLVIGRDVSITGFDDILWAELMTPSLTTVHQPAHQFGGMIAQMLFKVINNKPIEQKQIIVKPKLVVRESSGPCLV